ncbi:hypothetical protein CsSME_00002226 [Camellia sinensis var. sinensis]
MAASELKRQEGEMRRRPSKSRNRALELEGSTSVGSCNPGYAFTDGIKGQLRERFYELEIGHALGLPADGAAWLNPKTELLELTQVETVLLVLLGRKARAFSSAGRLAPLARQEGLCFTRVTYFELGSAGMQLSLVGMELG